MEKDSYNILFFCQVVYVGVFFRRERDDKRKKLMDPIYDLKNYVEKTKDAHSPERVIICLIGV